MSAPGTTLLDELTAAQAGLTLAQQHDFNAYLVGWLSGAIHDMPVLVEKYRKGLRVARQNALRDHATAGARGA